MGRLRAPAATPTAARFCFVLATALVPTSWLFVAHWAALCSSSALPPPLLPLPAPRAPLDAPPPLAPQAHPGTPPRPLDAAVGAVDVLPDVLEHVHVTEGSRPFRVLFVTDAESYASSPQRWFFHVYEAVRAMPGVEAHLWGPGFAGFDASQSVSSNAARRWGPGHFDFFFNNSAPAPARPSRRPSASSPRPYALGPGPGAPPVAVWPQDCALLDRLPANASGRVLSCGLEGAALVFMPYANHMAYYASEASGQARDRLLWHLPHAVHLPALALAPGGREPPPLERRRTDVLVVGALASLHPLRARLLRMLDSGRMAGRVAALALPAAWRPGNASSGGGLEAAAARAEEATTRGLYAQLLDAKVVLVSSGRRRAAAREYVEAAAAGALVVGDIPGEREDEFRRYVVELKEADADQALLGTIRHWLAGQTAEARAARAAEGRRVALGGYTTAHTAREVVRAMQAYLTGRRGLHFPHAYGIPDLFLPQTRKCSRSIAQAENKATDKDRKKPKKKKP
eukprot:m51a1_g5287 hypothetical protein (514) ;mRNA; f:197554-199515